MNLWILILFAVVVVVSFTVGFYFAQKRFWVQDRDSSRTARRVRPKVLATN